MKKTYTTTWPELQEALATHLNVENKCVEFPAYITECEGNDIYGIDVKKGMLTECVLTNDDRFVSAIGLNSNEVIDITVYIHEHSVEISIIEKEVA